MTTVAVRIAPLAEADLRRCVELERRLFPDDDPWSLAVFRSELRAGHCYFGAYAGDELIGYAGLSIVGTTPDAETSVHTIGVAPEWQGQGVGTALLRTMLGIADRLSAPVFLEVRADNDTAIKLYEAHGFLRLGLRKRYYQPSNADAYTMGRPADTTATDSTDSTEESE
ncbi:MAG TPA: ribosomal protein S18-alanine N-acetyltransferase [Pseudonocardiaceae bacterium]|nr:ribosomal protein S18-alanine N-acetyltransferase [Pseudonocardiaceae bacterium]